jgi:hypothetical protein
MYLRRKISFGNRSADGKLAVARLLTVSRTCQLQQINALVFLTAAIRCHFRRQAVASLLPKRLKPCYTPSMCLRLDCGRLHWAADDADTVFNESAIS